MKIIVKISGLYLLLCCSAITAQDLQKWYADDIYYNSNEKQTYIIKIPEDDIYVNDGATDSSYNEMSYTSRINRFHRDYFGTSIGFNYGYFHNPFLYNGFGFNYGYDPFFNYGIGFNYGYDPFFNYGFGFNYGYDPFFNYGFYNPWYSPWGINQFAWYDPYGFNYYGGYGHNPYFINTGLSSSSAGTYYGSRSPLSNNVSNTITRPVNRIQNSYRSVLKNLKEPSSKMNSTEVFSQEKYTIPKNERTRWEFSNSKLKNKTDDKSFIGRIEQILGADSPKQSLNGNKTTSNRKNKPTFNRNSQRSSNLTRSTPRTNGRSTNSRRPR